MSTQVFLVGQGSAACDYWGSGTAPWNPNTAFYNTSVTASTPGYCRLARGSSFIGVTGATVASSTARHRFGIGASTPLHFVSPPIDRDIAPSSSSITANLWMSESSMSANVRAAIYVAFISPAGVLIGSPWAANAAAEMGTAVAAENFTAIGGDGTSIPKGSRILIVPCWTNIGTQAAGFTTSFDYSGTTAGADGDSYVTFTEDFGFMQDSGASIASIASGGSTFLNIGDVSGNQRLAGRIRIPANRTLTSIDISGQRIGTPADSLEVAIQADSSGVPSGTDLTVATLSSAFPTSPSFGVRNADVADLDLSSDTVYWLVMRRTGAVDAANYYKVITGAAESSWNLGVVKRYSGTWADVASNYLDTVTLNLTAGSTLYPTTTAGEVDPNGSTHDSKEAWTSKGAGDTNAVTNTAAAPASPLLLTTSAGGNFIEWYTRKLQAFTLAGPVLVRVQSKESNAAANASYPGVEIAVCASDGTSPVVWGYTNPGLELSTLDGTFTSFFVAADDVAVTSGQRLRIRYYIDDASAAAMASGQTVTMVYGGAVAPDTLLTLGQVLAEATASAPPGLTDFYRQNNLIRR